jgi:hypothetical protein
VTYVLVYARQQVRLWAFQESEEKDPFDYV